MNATTPDTAMAHDDLVARIAARAFDTRIFTVYTNTQRALQRPQPAGEIQPQGRRRRTTAGRHTSARSAAEARLRNAGSL